MDNASGTHGYHGSHYQRDSCFGGTYRKGVAGKGLSVHTDGVADPCRLHRLKEASESWGAIGGACATLLGRLRCFASNDHGSPEWLMRRDVLLTPLS